MLSLRKRAGAFHYAFAALFGFAMGMGCQGFWYGDVLAGCVPITIGMIYLIPGRWKRAGTRRAQAGGKA